MNSLLEIYHEAFQDLSFSITGHVNLNKKINTFYERFAKTSLIKYNPKITLLFSALLKLENSEDEKKALAEWHLKAFDSFFYKTFVEGDKEEALSFYFWLLNKYGKEAYPRDNISLRPSIIFSKLFIADLDLRIGLIKNKEKEKPIVRYDKQKKVFEFLIPISIFNLEGIESNNDLKIDLHQKWKHKASFLKQNKDEDKIASGIYSLNEIEENSNFQKIYESLINEDIKSEVTGTIIKHLDLLSKEFRFLKKDYDPFEEFNRVALCVVSLSFVCLYYDSFIEYFLSIAKVEYWGDREEHRNLGGLIVGYKCNDEITSEERVLFNLTSDRLASVIATDYFYRTEELKELKGLQFQKCYLLYRQINDYIHTDRYDAITKEKLIRSKERIQENKIEKILTNETFSKLTNYINEIEKTFDDNDTANSKNKRKEIINEGNKRIRESLRLKLQDIIRRTNFDEQLHTCHYSNSCHNYELYSDINFLIYILNGLIENSRHANEQSVNFTLKLFDDETLTQESEFESKAKYLSIRYQDAGPGCPFERIEESENFWKPFVHEDYMKYINSLGKITVKSGTFEVDFNPKISKTRTVQQFNGFIVDIVIKLNEKKNNSI